MAFGEFLVRGGVEGGPNREWEFRHALASLSSLILTTCIVGIASGTGKPARRIIGLALIVAEHAGVDRGLGVEHQPQRVGALEHRRRGRLREREEHNSAVG